MIIAIAALLTLGAIVYTIFIRPQDVPEPEPPSPFHHLDEMKARIYENLRDLQFEYRVGKLSDDDYQRTKQGLQMELATVMKQVDDLKAQLSGKATAAAAPAAKPAAAKAADKAAAPAPGTVCPHCGAKFEQSLKFCGECGKAIHA